MRMRSLLAAGSVAFFAGCWGENNPSAPAIRTIDDQAYIVALTTPPDFSEGNLGVISPSTARTYANQLKFESSDLAIRQYQGNIYIIKRLFAGDNIVRINGADLPSSISKSSVVYEKNLGVGVSLQDIAFASPQKAYVTEHNTPYLMVIDPASGAKRDSINLSSFSASAERPPNMSPAVVSGPFLYVACQRLDNNWTPADSGCIVVIETATDSIRRSVYLSHGNPVAMAVWNNRLLIACNGVYNNFVDGAMISVDLATFAATVLFTDSDVQGSICGVEVTAAGKGYVAVYKEEGAGRYWNEILPFDAATGALGAKIQGIDNAFGGMAAGPSGRYLYIGDRGEASPGVYAVDTQTHEIIAGPYKVGMPPMCLVAVGK